MAMVMIDTTGIVEKEGRSTRRAPALKLQNARLGLAAAISCAHQNRDDVFVFFRSMHDSSYVGQVAPFSRVLATGYTYIIPPYGFILPRLHPFTALYEYCVTINSPLVTCALVKARREGERHTALQAPYNTRCSQRPPPQLPVAYQLIWPSWPCCRVLPLAFHEVVRGGLGPLSHGAAPLATTS